ncbi:hypothetical protein BJ165DRAFT_1534274 [Panaeolus papilionaceus]|nr:hypothetical protein BJ165DRAFT_1534274 [Panaeolus papilionaceus]
MAQIPSLAGGGLSPSSKPSQIRFSFTSTTNAIRTLRVSTSSTGASGWVALVDSMIFEVDDPIISPPPPSPKPPTTTQGGTISGVQNGLIPSPLPLISNNPLRTVGSDTSSIFTGTSTLFTSPGAASSPIYLEPNPPNIPNGLNPISSPPTTTFLVSNTIPTTPTSMPSMAVPTLFASDQGRNKESKAVLIVLIVCAVLVLMLIIGGVLWWYAIKKRREGRVDHNGERSLEIPMTPENKHVPDEEEKFEEKPVEQLKTLVSFPVDAHTWSSQFDSFTASSGPSEPNRIATTKPAHFTANFTRNPSPLTPSLNLPHQVERITSSSNVGQFTTPYNCDVSESVASNSGPTSVASDVRALALGPRPSQAILK